MPSAAAPAAPHGGSTSLLGSIVGGIAGFATGGIGGAITGWQAGGGGSTLPALPGGGSTGGGINMPWQVNGPGGVPLPGFNPQGVTAAGGSCPKGYHLNKHPLAATHRHGAVPARSLCVRNRSMQALNSRAITRSLKRIKRARKLVSKLHAFGAARSRGAPARGGHRAGCNCVVCRRR